MPEVEVHRRLVKSPPELWAELSDVEGLARHLGEFGEIRITRTDPETTVAWEGERARGTVEIEPSGWGTKVTLTAEPVGANEAAPKEAKPDPDPAPKPIAKPAPGPITNPIAKPAPDATANPTAKASPGPVAHPAREPIAKPAPEPIAHPAPEPIAKPNPEPVAKRDPFPEPIAKPKPEPVAKPIPIAEAPIA